MKKIFAITTALALCCLIPTGGIKAAAAENLSDDCKAAYVCDEKSGTVIYAKEETKRLPIASMCKIMTLLLSFECIERGELTYDEEITASERAAGMGGSQVFLGSGLSYPAEQLLKSIAVCSANDSCVAMAERVAGSEAAFIERMNTRAKELGAENTLFSNCTGLPKDPQYSCAKDVSIMLRELVKHEKYFELTRVWTENFCHPDGRETIMTNTNKLVRFYQGCDGGKTGFTNEAGFCLAATAKRGNTRIISVVIGASSAKSRNAQVSALFDDAFANYESQTILEAGEILDQTVGVGGSRVKEVGVKAEDALSAFTKRGETHTYTVDVKLETLSAPVTAGQSAGEAILLCDGKEIARTRLLCANDAPAYTYWDAFREAANHWN